MILQHALALVAVGATFLVVGVLHSTVVDLPALILLYLVPIVLVASRWGRGPAVTAALAAILGHDLLFVARRSVELKTALLRAVTHNLRTPLASIKAGVSGLRQPDAAFADEDRLSYLLRAVMGRGYEDATGTLRVPLGSLRKKLEANPATPRIIVTEPGIGYRLQVD